MALAWTKVSLKGEAEVSRLDKCVDEGTARVREEIYI